jgi:hypothetical protein
MADGTRGPDHVRLVMIKAMRALTRYAPKDYFARTPPAKSGFPESRRVRERDFSCGKRRETLPIMKRILSGVLTSDQRREAENGRREHFR